MTGPVVTRRRMLQAGAGALMVGFTMVAAGAVSSCHARGPAEAHPINAWVRIGADGRVTIRVGQSEIGQGITTALPQIIAEELDVNWASIGFELANDDQAFIHPVIYSSEQITGGSTSTFAFYLPARKAGAAARYMLIAAAAARWGVAPARLAAADGRVVHPDSKEALSYSELAEEASKMAPPVDPVLKPDETFGIIGTPVKRLDSPAKVRGEAVYGIDFELPGMRYAAVRQNPHGSRAIAAVDDSALAAMGGNPRVVRVYNGVAVVADRYWQAITAVEALGIQYEPSEAVQLDQAAVMASLRAGLDSKPVVVTDKGDVEALSALPGIRTVTADYEVPYLAHATMEPMNCTARYRDGSLEVWAPTQAPTLARAAAADVLGIPAERVTVHTLLAGGGFGRRGGSDFVRHAAQCAKAEKGAVKVIWTREQDMRHDTYRPAMACRAEATIDAKGALVGLKVRNAGPGVWANTRPELVRDGVDPLVVEGLTDRYYDIPNERVEQILLPTHLPLGFWRSVGYSHNLFFLESIIDEAAHVAGADPYIFRRTLAAHDKRLLAVLDDVADRAGWKPQAAMGIAAFYAPRWQTPVAVIAQVALVDGQIAVKKVVCSADPGVVVNPDVAKSQIEGGIIFGVSAALYGEISIAGGNVEQSNFHDYRMVTLADAPAVDVRIMASGGTPGGVGELGTPAVIPAITNAIFAATGRRIRRLPVAAHEFAA